MSAENDEAGSRRSGPPVSPSGHMSDWPRLLIGEWKVFVRPGVYQTTELGHAQATTQNTLAGFHGTAIYKDITYGTHIHGEYKLDPEGGLTGCAVLIQQSGAGGGPLAVTAASDAGRFCGGGSFVEGSLVCVGTGTPFAESIEGCPSPTDVFQTGLLTVHPLRDGLWVLVAYHAFRGDDIFKLVRTVIWHGRDEKETDSRPEREPDQSLEANPDPARSARLVDLEDHLATLTQQLDESRGLLEDATEGLAELENGQESAEADILEAEFEQCGYRSSNGQIDEADDRRPAQVARIRAGYAAVFGFLEQIAALQGEYECLSHAVDELEDEVDEVRDRLDEGYSTWVDEQVRKAEALPGSPPASDWCGLIPGELVGRLSEDARKIIGTFHKLHHIYSREADLQSLDWGPLVGTMSKVCERILSDFLEPRCRAIFDDPALAEIFATKTNYTDGIPEPDRAYRVENSALHRILDFRKKPGPYHWSGRRSAAIALLLFGRRFRTGAEPGREIDNPLKLFGTEEDRTALRCDLYRLQELRNGFIHHDPADQDQAVEVMACFRSCVRRLCVVLFGAADSVTDGDESKS